MPKLHKKTQFCTNYIAAYIASRASQIVDNIGSVYGNDIVSQKIHHLKHLPNMYSELGPMAMFMSTDFENYLSFLRDLIHSKIGLDSPFIFSSNLNFFVSIFDEYAKNKNIISAANEKPKKILYESKQINLNQEQKETVRRSLYKYLHPEGRNYQLSNEWGDIQAFSWCRYCEKTYSSVTYESKNCRAVRKNCYVYRIENGDYFFYEIELIFSVSFNGDRQLFLFCRIFQVFGSIEDNFLDPKMKISNNNSCLKLDDSVRKMSMLIQGDWYYPVLE